MQREQIERWADGRGFRLLTVFEELDESGGRADRPLLEEAMRRIEDGISQGLVVAKVDRFGRSLIDGLVAVERVQKAGGTFFSVSDGLDAGTDTGRLVLRIMLSMAEWEMERIRAGWDTAHAKLIERGAYAGTYTPVGYRRTRSGRLRPDPVTGPVVSELFDRRSQGWSIPRLCRWLETQKVLTAKGNPGWTNSSLAGLLGRRVYVGEVCWGDYVHAGAHVPLTDPVIWQVAQRPRPAPIAARRPRALLAGLARCASCSMTLSVVSRRQPNGAMLRSYLCRGRRAAGRCPGAASISADYLEPYVECAVLELLHRRRRVPVIRLAAAEAALLETEAVLACYRDSERYQRALGELEFARGLHVRADRVRDARLAVAAVRAQHATHALAPTSELEAGWPTAELEDKRKVISTVIDCLFVAPGRLHVQERVRVCPAGTAPARLPRMGDKGNRARPYTSAATRGTRYQWSDSRIERELRRLLKGRRSWLTRDELQAAGQARLHLQVVLGAGEHWWAHRLGVRIEAGVQARAPWTDERIRRTLALYLAGQQTWPTITQFQADGMHSLRLAVTASGGKRRWALEFPKVGPTPRRRPNRNQATHRPGPELAEPVTAADHP